MKHKHISVLTLFLAGATAAFPQVSINTTPTRSVGQPLQIPQSANPNRVEGRELNLPQGIALDTSVSSPIVYVADFRNNRVLAWKNATGFSNGQKADLVIGQSSATDFFSTNPQGPGLTFSGGLTAPTGLAVNANGDLYVVDTGNNRVLRYPKPFQQRSQVAPDLWIGQASLQTRTVNYTGQISATGLALATNNSAFQASLAFDSSGNLWLTDPGNARVLRYPAANLKTTGGPIAADIVIGQPTLSSTFTPALTATTQNQQVANQFYIPSGLTFDHEGRLYVSDSLNRVLVFTNPAGLPGNASADRFMGVYPPNSGPTTLTQAGVTSFSNPGGLFVLPNDDIGVIDSGDNRIVIFPPYSQWPDKPAPPQAVQPGGVIGQQGNFTLFFPNNAAVSGLLTPPPSSSSLWGPIAAAFLPSTNELFIADAFNNRVVVMPLLSGVLFDNAKRVLGQDRFDQYSINLIEGKEFQFTTQPPYTSGSSVDAGIALDTTTGTPHLYVADPYNNRVLGFRDARKISTDLGADLVIGQPDMATALCNYNPQNPGASGDPTRPNQTSLCRPYGLLVDSKGNLYVADSANGRVLRFPSPFANPRVLEPADLVLGQQNFTSQLKDPGQGTMGAPYGLAFTGTNGLMVSDFGFNRVVYIPFTNNGTFTAGTDNGTEATKVLGQPDFFTKDTGSGDDRMNAPHHIAADTSGRVYVVDSGNNRVLIFSDPTQLPRGGSHAVLTLGNLASPRGIYVNSGTNEIWVTDTNRGTVVRYPEFGTLFVNPTFTATIPDAVNNQGLLTLAVAQDQYGDLFVADGDNRVVVYYQGLAAQNAASNLAYKNVAPGMIASLYAVASTTQFGSNTATAQTTTWPTTLGDIQVLFNGTPAPIDYVGPNQINFYVPMSAPTTGTAQVEVQQQSTGQVLGAAQVNMTSVAPGLFLCPTNQSGTNRQACVINEDNTLNSANNPAPRGSVISIYGTGQGVVANAPPDGSPAPIDGTLITVAGATTKVIINTCLLDMGTNAGTCQIQPNDVGTSTSKTGQWVSFSGLAPGFVGLWQVNVQIPMATPPGSAVPIAVLQNDIGSTDANSGFRTTIAVK